MSMEPGSVIRPVHRTHPMKAIATATTLVVLRRSWNSGTERATTMNGARYCRTVEADSDIIVIDWK